MRRIIVLLTVALVMAAMMVAMTVPAFAASDNANCQGRNASGGNQFGKENGDPGFGGRALSVQAQGGGVGEAASTNCNSR